MFFDLSSDSLDYKTQYKNLILKHHPDKGGDTATFGKVQAEYKTLLVFASTTKCGDSWADIMDEEEIIRGMKAFTAKVLEQQ